MSEELGEPVTYSTERGAMVPLSRATIWPEHLDDHSARNFAARLEHKSAEAMGARLCPHTHASWINPEECPGCGAAL